MAFFDLSWDELQAYRPERVEPPDFDAFWARTLAEAHLPTGSEPARFTPFESYLDLIQCWDVTFTGFAGQPVRAWYLRPRTSSGRLPGVVEFIGYGGGRGFPNDWLIWPTAGYAYLVMDTRGQGSVWLKGDTGDVEAAGNPQSPGFMTRGILAPETYYYRRVMADAARAVETLRERPEVDPARVAVTGTSQGGGLALAAAALVPDVAVCMADVPFLCHYRRATEITDALPYAEISRYLAVHRDQVEAVFHTLSYFDGVNFAPRIQAHTLISVGLMDEICPPSTVMAMYNHLTVEKSVRVYRYNHHDGGGTFHVREKLRFLRSILGEGRQAEETRR
ncbi:MAG: alpha/beta fold hydrolase [Armatimonadetes bacterium]|nr:alpha/beta fold hydrolase [Armatimonadota bacterium]